MSDTQAWLGKILPPDVGRDATHLAVVPMVAATEMEPGTHCGPLAEGMAGLTDTPIGIVDPFLTENVKKGQRFYLCLYPRTVTGLRHVYDHPALDDDRARPTQKQASEKWLREFCSSADCPGYEEVLGKVMEHEKKCDDDADYLFFRDVDAHGAIPPEFWDHAEAVTGQRLNRRARYFTCSC